MLHRIIGNALRSEHSVNVHLKDQLRCRRVQRPHHTIFTFRGRRQACRCAHSVHHEPEEVLGVRANRENRIRSSGSCLHQFHADLAIANVKRVSRNPTGIVQADGLRYRRDYQLAVDRYDSNLRIES